MLLRGICSILTECSIIVAFCQTNLNLINCNKTWTPSTRVDDQQTGRLLRVLSKYTWMHCIGVMVNELKSKCNLSVLLQCTYFIQPNTKMILISLKRRLSVEYSSMIMHPHQSPHCSWCWIDSAWLQSCFAPTISLSKIEVLYHLPPDINPLAPSITGDGTLLANIDTFKYLDSNICQDGSLNKQDDDRTSKTSQTPGRLWNSEIEQHNGVPFCRVRTRNVDLAPQQHQGIPIDWSHHLHEATLYCEVPVVWEAFYMANTSVPTEEIGPKLNRKIRPNELEKCASDQPHWGAIVYQSSANF